MKIIYIARGVMNDKKNRNNERRHTHFVKIIKKQEPVKNYKGGKNKIEK